MTFLQKYKGKKMSYREHEQSKKRKGLPREALPCKWLRTLKSQQKLTKGKN